jgi:hypothetical protein
MERTAPVGFARARSVVVIGTLVAAALITNWTDDASGGQIQLLRGQTVAPVFEGWDENPDGSYTLIFGYFNRNWEEEVDVPVGPNNTLDPGGPDQGQPTHFFPRRNRFVFRVQVPKDFEKKEIVWTLTTRGKTERAYATLHPDYILERDMLQRNMVSTTPPGMRENQPPVVAVEGETSRTVRVGQPLSLTALVKDDGLLKPRPSPILSNSQPAGHRPAYGLRVAWYIYRGSSEKVTFDPEQFKVYPDYDGNSPFAAGWAPPPLPPDGRFPVRVTFGAPGDYVLQVMAHDGGFGVTQSVRVTVNP